MTSFIHHTTVDAGRTEITAEIDVVTWGEPASYDHPGCGPEVEIAAAWLTDEEDDENAMDLLGALSSAEIERIETEFLENPPEPEYGDD